MDISQQYVGAIVILVVSLLKIFGVEIANEAITGIVTGVIAIWIAIRRHNVGDITLTGSKK